MTGVTRFIIYLSMCILMVVSMWTTYVSLRDSILPEPVLPITLPMGEGLVWDCSVFALLLSVAIGLMLLGLKLAIIDGHKRLNLVGVVGLTVIAFISISFNMDVLYRTANRDFFVSYSADQMRQVYEEYAARAQQGLNERRDALRKELAVQEVELEAEIEGIRQAPAGYGQRAREEEYKLRLMEGEAAVELESIETVLAARERFDALLSQTPPQTIAEVEQLQSSLRVQARELGVFSGVPLPHPVKLDSPIFAVFSKLFDIEHLGMMEVFLLLIAFFLDLGDIIGYSLIPAAHRKRAPGVSLYTPEPAPTARAEYVPDWEPVERREERSLAKPEEDDFFGESRLGNLPASPRQAGEGHPPPPRSFRIRRR